MHFAGESAKYRAARNALLAQEIELRRQTERVAAQRRALPVDGMVPEDYQFEGDGGPVKLSELFAPGKDTLAIYSFMFGPDSDYFDDQARAFDALGAHLEALLAAARGDPERTAQRARRRGGPALHFRNDTGVTLR